MIRSLTLGILMATLGCARPEPPEPTARELLAAPCAIDAQGNMSLTVADGETASLSRRVSDGKVVANAINGGAECTVADTARIAIDGDAGDNKVILDYANGMFAAGGPGGPGIVIALGAEMFGDSVKLRGTAGADAYTLGASGAAIDGDAAPDVGFSGVEDVVVSTGAGNDVVSGGGSAGTGPALPISLSVYGGDGDDTLTGGAAASYLYGGAGDDTLSASHPDDTLDCGAGEDTALQPPMGAAVSGCER